MKEDFEQAGASGRGGRNSPGESPERSPKRPEARLALPSGGWEQEGGTSYWVLLDILLQRWRWLALTGVALGAAFFFLGWRVIKPKYTATAQLLRFETPGTGEFFKTTSPLSSETFASLICSPDLLRKVGDQSRPPLAPEKLLKRLKVDPQPDSDLVKISLAAAQPAEAVNLLNRYVQAVVSFTRELQAGQAAVVANAYLRKQVEQMDSDITMLHQEFRNLPGVAPLTNKLAEVGSRLSALNHSLSATGPPNSALLTLQAERLNRALGELGELTSKYTEIHPLVKQKESEVEALRSQMAHEATNANPSGSVPALALAGGAGQGREAFNPELDIIRTKLLSLEEGRVQLANRQREAELYAANPPGLVRVFAPATLQSVRSNWHWLKIALGSVAGMIFGMGLGLVLVLLVELADGRLRTAADVARVTRLPVLTALGDLNRMNPQARAQWAFRAWTMLQGRLSLSVNHGLVCGITSSAHAEGRSTWIQLLAEAATLTGYRVLTIATQPSPGLPTPAEPASESSKPAVNSAPAASALTLTGLTSLTQVTAKLTGDNAEPKVHIPLPGWVWNLERRKEWREAINEWRQIENLVILVELPPAGVSEAVLLGSNLPNILWLACSGAAHAEATREQLQTLRDARCHLVGAVFNRQARVPLRRRFPRWLVCAGLMAALAGLAAQAQTEPAPAEAPPGSQTNRFFSVVQPSQRAAWQQRLTLGPGDVLNLGLYGQPELNRADVVIGPDGRVSYLEAQDVLATGRTLDELRADLDQSLSQYRRSPRTVITPVAFRSKKYYVLGKVMVKGVYALDRPLTVLEAIARAKGLENGLVDRNVVDLSDFSRSFVARGGKRFPLDFERLFQEGDLSQNVPVEPGDYIYIAGSDMPEVYVVGEVRAPGPVAYKTDMTVVGAIANRGGFTERAYRAKVLVVRGSLSHPEAIPVDTHAIVEGKALDFRLRPKDIVFVNSRPFIRVEELADLAATAFVQSLISSWVDVDVLKPFNQ